MRDWTIDTYLGRLAARHPTPAGAAVAALNLAQGAALLAMVARFRAVPGTSRTTCSSGRRHVRETALRLAEADAGRRRGGRPPPTRCPAPPRPSARGARRRSPTPSSPPRVHRPSSIPVGAELVGLCERMAEVASGALLADVAAAADAAAAALSISRTNVEADIGPRRGSAGGRAPRRRDSMSVDDLLLRAARVRDGIRRALAGT